MKHQTALSIGTLAVLALVVSGCAQQAAPGGDNDATPSTLYFTSWGGGYQEAQSAAFVQPFAEANGVEIVEDSPTDYVKIESMVEAGNVTWDVTDNDPFFVNPNCGTLFEELDPDLDFTGVPEELITPCAVPSALSGQLFLYNTEKFPDAVNAPANWQDFFDVEKFPGKRAIGNYVTYGAVEGALLADGVAPDDLYPLDFDRAFAKLDSIRDHLVFWDTGAQQEQMIAAGDVELIISWSGRAAGQIRDGAPYAPVWQDAILNYNVLAVTKGTKNKDLAMEFIEHALSKESQAELGSLISYSPANTDATPILDDVAKQFDINSPDAGGKGVYQDMVWWGDNLDRGVELWTAWAVG